MGYSIFVFAKENGIILQTLPPHPSNASQPLDRTNYGPFKCHLAESHANWIREDSGERMSIYEVPLLSKPAILRAFTETNIKKGFHATGIFPLDPNAIPNNMFAASIVTSLRDLKNFYFKKSKAYRLLRPRNLEKTKIPTALQILLTMRGPWDLLGSRRDLSHST
jgi:hypothetical protein